MLVIFLLIFLLSRLVNLTLLPVFNDEAIYVNWGQIMTTKGGMLFYSLFDGKQPLLIWIFGLVNKIIPDPFFSGRLVSVFASLLTFCGLYLLGKKFFSYPLSLLPAFIYLTAPLFTFFDRQALMEGVLITINVWSLYFITRYLTKKNLKTIIFLGIILGVGLFVKSTAVVFLILSFAVFLFLGFQQKKSFKLNPFVALLILILIVFVILLPLIVQPNFKVIFTRGERFNLTLTEILKLPASVWTNNIFSLTTISFWHLTPPLFLLTIYGLWVAFKKRLNLLLFWFLGGIFITILTARGLSPRYVVALLPLISIFASFSIFNFFKKSYFLGSLTLILLIIPLFITSLLLFNPLSYFNLMNRLTSHYSQKSDYVTGDTSGYGLSEVYKYLEEKAENSPVIVGVRLDAGNPENAILAYYFNSPKIKAVYFDRQMFSSDFDFSQIKSPVPIYFVSRSQHQGGLENYLIEEKRFYKPEGKSYFGVYRFAPTQ